MIDNQFSDRNETQLDNGSDRPQYGLLMTGLRLAFIGIIGSTAVFSTFLFVALALPHLLSLINQRPVYVNQITDSAGLFLAAIIGAGAFGVTFFVGVVLCSLERSRASATAYNISWVLFCIAAVLFVSGGIASVVFDVPEQWKESLPIVVGAVAGLIVLTGCSSFLKGLFIDGDQFARESNHPTNARFLVTSMIVITIILSLFFGFMLAANQQGSAEMASFLGMGIVLLAFADVIICLACIWNVSVGIRRVLSGLRKYQIGDGDAQ